MYIQDWRLLQPHFNLIKTFLLLSSLIKYPFPLTRSYIDFKSCCRSGQNKLRQLTIPAKLLHPLDIVAEFNFWIASIFVLMGFTHTVFPFKIVLCIYCNSFLNDWHILGEIFDAFFSKVFRKFAFVKFFVWSK